MSFSLQKYKTEILIILCILLIFIVTSTFAYYSLSSSITIYTKKPIETKLRLIERPLHEFIICSSHNSYLRGIQHGSDASPLALQRVLEYGARSIELDINMLPDGTPIVVHGLRDTFTTGFVPLEKMVDVILEYGFRTSDPLFLFCEILRPDSIELNTKIKKIFMKSFGSKISMPDGTIDPDNFIGYKPIQLFLNKLLLFGTMDKHGILSEIMYPSFNVLNVDHKHPKALQLKQSKQLSRIYKKESMESVFSINIDFIPFWKNGHNMVTMDFQTEDIHLKKYLDSFKDHSFIHLSELSLN